MTPSTQSSPSSSPRFRQPLLYFLQLTLNFLELFYMTGITKSVFLSVWLLSLSTIILRFIHDTACVNSSFSITEYSIVWIHYELFV